MKREFTLSEFSQLSWPCQTRMGNLEAGVRMKVFLNWLIRRLNEDDS